MTPLQIGLAFGIIMALVVLWAVQKSSHSFDLRDTLIDDTTGKASLNATILWAMALLSIWVVVDRENDGKDDVSTLLLGVLGIFVTGRVAAQGIATFKPKPDPGSSVESTVSNVKTVTTTGVKKK